MKIAVFDSGIGGLSVLHLALQKLPKEDFLYFADEDHVPYGTKSKEEIIQYVEESIEFLLQEEVKAIVIACNTATSAAIQEMRNKYSLPLIGMEPAVKKAVDYFGEKRILVMATPITVQGEKMQDLISRVDKEHLVDLIAMPRLVSFAEKEIFEGKELGEYLQEQLFHYDFNQYSSLVLGCTHFNYFKDSLRDVLPPHVNILDGNEGTINKLIVELREKNLLEEQKERTIEFYYSGRKVGRREEKERLHRYLKRLDKMLTIE